MIRPTTPEDAGAIVALAVAAGMFTEAESGALAEVLADHFAGKGDLGGVWVTDEEGGLPCGVAYYTPAQMTDRTWYLKMIAVRPDLQGRGRGSALMRHVEDALREGGQRIVLVETSGLPKYDRTRAFYAKCGYDLEARVRGFYTTGDDMVLFRKSLDGE